MSIYATLEEHPYLGVAAGVAAGVGALHIWLLAFSYACLLWDVLVPHNPLPTYGASKTRRNWAVVTGCTAGIGEEFALQLAKRGFNVGLVGRNLSKLELVAEKVRKTGAEAASFQLDSSVATAPDYDRLGQWAQQLGSVTVLINNVGVSHNMPVPFDETSRDEMHNIIQVNDVSTLEITQAVLPAVRQSVLAKKADRGLILTMGSFAGLTPTPYLATYIGSKAFLQGWNSALAAELKSSNIDAQLVLSYLVTSKMSKVRKTSALIPNPKQFVGSTIRCIGKRGGAQERAFTSTPFWSHALLHWWLEVVLGVYSKLLSSINLNMHVQIRKRALKKKAKTQ